MGPHEFAPWHGVRRQWQVPGALQSGRLAQARLDWRRVNCTGHATLSASRWPSRGGSGRKLGRHDADVERSGNTMTRVANPGTRARSRRDSGAPAESYAEDDDHLRTARSRQGQQVHHDGPDSAHASRQRLPPSSQTIGRRHRHTIGLRKSEESYLPASNS